MGTVKVPSADAARYTIDVQMKARLIDLVNNVCWFHSPKGNNRRKAQKLLAQLIDAMQRRTQQQPAARRKRRK